jgi:diguanylate cyclase (GGDEF)-like protein
MRFPHRVVVLVLVAVWCQSVKAQLSPASGAEPATLTTAHSVHSLTIDQANRNYPVHLRVVVTYFDPYVDARRAALFVHDQTGSIFVSVTAKAPPPLRPGDLIDIVGVSAAGDYAPIVKDPRIQVISKSQLPQRALHPAMSEMLSGSVDGQWVQLDGVVRAVRIVGHDATLELETTEGPMSATTVVEPAVDYNNLVDAVVRVVGNEAPQFNRKRQMVGAHLYFPSMQQIRILQAAPADPFATPRRSIAQLLQFTPGQEFVHRVRVHGQVTLQWPGRMLCIEDEGNGLCMETEQEAPVGIGDELEVIGFPAVLQYKATLVDAAYRVARSKRLPLVADPISAEQAFQGNHDMELIQVDGELIGRDRTTGSLALMLRSGKYLFPAILPFASGSQSLSQLKDGSTLRLTGICSAQIDPGSTNRGEGEVRLGSVQILLRASDDIQVLKVPSWWSREHALELLIAVGIISFVAVAWIVVLRRRVEQQTRALRASEERLRHLSLHDALTGLPNRVLLADRLDVALNRAGRFKAVVGVLMLDLDRFKEVNDVLGHHAGDQLLCQVGDRLRQSVRKTDTVARLGGDEFVVLLPDLQAPEDAELIAGKIVLAVAAPIEVDSRALQITVSVGVCTHPPTEGDAGRLLQKADAALYRVKANGKNGFEVDVAAKSQTLRS